MLLITGATGQLGSAVAQQLRQRQAKDWAVFARDAAKARPFADHGIAVRVGDFDDPASLATAFDGIQKLLLISSRSMDRAAQQRQVVDAALATGVRHIVYTGLAIRDIATSHVRGLMQSHFDTEAHIRASGVAYTFLRNTMYTDALPEIIGPTWRQQGIHLPAGNGRVPFALRREIGEATANLLLQDGHAMQTYDITGSASVGFDDIAQALSHLTGQTVRYADADPAVFAQRLHANGQPKFMVDLTCGTALDVRDHQYELDSDTLPKLLGRQPAGLSDALMEVFGRDPSASVSRPSPR
jgi:NAD(P)H dehydrogenase (quinone)